MTTPDPGPDAGLVTVIVETTSGAVRGRVRDDGGREWLGVPFAVADRFAPPRRAPAAAAVLDATAWGAVCPQPPGDLFMGVDQHQHEDCLNLNVWAPPGTTAGDRLPVMVWVHGGGFRTGGGSHVLSHGHELARRGGVVVVTINYRLGTFGFLAHADLGGGNWGLLDQIEALRWVADNIAAFGGDPGNVTVFGESAGGVSVALLLASPLTTGLIHRAAVQSGAATAAPFDRAAATAEDVAAAAGVGVADLRRLPAAELLAAQQGVEARGRGMRFTPVVDGVVLDRPPEEALAAGRARGIPTIVGTNADEVRLLGAGDRQRSTLDEGALRRRLVRTLGDGADDVLATFRRTRGPDATPADLWFAIESDRYFRVPALRLADALAAHEPATFTYLFTWRSPGLDGWLGACHVLEIPFVFGHQGRDDIAWFTGSGPAADALAARMMDAWVALARTGDPSTPDLSWPRHDPATRPTLVFGTDCRMEHAPHEEERAAVARWSTTALGL